MMKTIALLLCLSTTVEAFTPCVSSFRSCTILSMTEESEWYAPPPSMAPQSEPVRYSSNATPSIVELQSHLDLQDYLSAPDSRLTILLFHAQWCRSCHKFQRYYRRLAAEKADWMDGDNHVSKRGQIRLASLEWSAHTDLCRSLGVEKLPTVYFYVDGVKIDGFSCGPSKFAKVIEAIAAYKDKSSGEIQLERVLDQASSMLQIALAEEVLDEESKWWKRLQQ